jgi:saccharopine dehydrogenase (NAD+, L-lysine forming)
MTIIALIREGKVPADNRVALTPAQCKWIQRQYNDVTIIVQQSQHRCYSDDEYRRTGIQVKADVSEADIFLGIKEVPVSDLVTNKTYLFFSHTKKKQLHNQKLLQAILEKRITLIDFECFEHEDGQRIIGFGFFAGIVGAHNGMMAYGNRTRTYALERVYKQKDFRSLIHTYFGLKLPNVKVAVTGSGRVAHGITEIMNLMGVIEVEKEEYLEREFSYPVYVQLKGADLYEHEGDKTYKRDHFHHFPTEYKCTFVNYVGQTDILMNGIYWDKEAPRLFEKEDITKKDFRIQTIADITDDIFGSVPINYGDQPIENPVYGVDRATLDKTEPYLTNSIDIMAVGNLPNELPRDASRYFGEQLIKYIFPYLLTGETDVMKKATIAKEGTLTPLYEYLKNYAKGE